MLRTLLCRSRGLLTCDPTEPFTCSQRLTKVEIRSNVGLHRMQNCAAETVRSFVVGDSARPGIPIFFNFLSDWTLKWSLSASSTIPQYRSAVDSGGRSIPVFQTLSCSRPTLVAVKIPIYRSYEQDGRQ